MQNEAYLIQNSRNTPKKYVSWQGGEKTEFFSLQCDFTWAF